MTYLETTHRRTQNFSGASPGRSCTRATAWSSAGGYVEASQNANVDIEAARRDYLKAGGNIHIALKRQLGIRIAPRVEVPFPSSSASLAHSASQMSLPDCYVQDQHWVGSWPL